VRASLADRYPGAAGGSRVLGLLPWFAALAVPFVLTAALLGNLSQALHTFHGSDEWIYHLPVVRSFAQQLPLPDFSSYNSATTPLFHWVFAVIASLTGAETPALRAFNVLISFATVAMVFLLLSEDRGWRRRDAFLAAAAFGLSPYFFGASFLVLTDNLAWLFVVVAMWMLLRAVSAPQAAAPWLLSCAAIGCALLTRQTHVWLVFVLVATLAVASIDMRKRVSVLAVLAVCLLPVAALVVVWGGPVPPPFQSGGASQIVHDPGSRVNVKALIFLVSLIGLYGVALRPALMQGLGRPRIAAATAAVASSGCVLLAAYPIQRVVGSDDGFLWLISSHLPSVAGTSLLFWLLLPAGIAVMVAAWIEGRTSLTTIGLGSTFVVAAVSTGFVFQKYFDPLVPLLLTLGRPEGEPLRRTDVTGYVLVVLGGAGYAVLQATRG
jgi:4-amino-4-deoxy-L-arabinose transferase-like glycosyltransferase